MVSNVVCRAYTFGDSYLAEVDIVLPASMRVAESHDIAEELQVCQGPSMQLVLSCSNALLCGYGCCP